MTASYASERQQFGVPIATFQAVGHQQADSFIDIECLRLVSQQLFASLLALQHLHLAALESTLLAFLYLRTFCSVPLVRAATAEAT